MEDFKKLIAHYDEEDISKKQLLMDHLFEVSKRAKCLGEMIGLGNTCELQGYLHDFGKSSEPFQLYIKGEYKGRVNHSSAGAKILDYIEEKVRREYDVDGLMKHEGIKPIVWKIYKEILQYPILAHHGLYDIINNDLDYHTGLRLDYDKDGEYDFEGRGLRFYRFLEDEYMGLNGKHIYTLYYDGFIEFIKIYKKLFEMAAKMPDSENKNKNKHRKRALYFYYGALVRLLLSILKDADIYDSSNYYRDHKDRVYSQDELDAIWMHMSDSVEELYAGFSNKPDKSDLDKIRNRLANDIYEFAQSHDSGAYELSMPVGSGKTYAGLRYAVANAKKYKKSRIFYTTAFLSVLEQNASSIKGVLGDEYVLEHHSNIIEDSERNDDDDDKNEYQVQEYLKESWESPVVLTTVVQLSNTMFKGRSSNIRRFAKLINSVIIIDEIQSLPVKALYNFNLMTNFLVNIMNCNVVHCTATNPRFDSRETLEYPCFYGDKSKDTSIVRSMENLEVFDRVDYYSLLGEDLNRDLTTEEVISHIKGQLEDDMSALIVLNTKRAVFNLYNGLLTDSEIDDLGWELVYLTTNQCPKHRLDIIENMKSRLKALRKGESQRKLICVSTKLVEAGVDIDFDLVYRSLSGIDSIVQCGGRCNREGKKLTKGKLFIFKYGEDNLKYLPDIEKQRSAAGSVLGKLQNDEVMENRINIEDVCENYFLKLYSNENMESRHLEFPIDKNGGGNTILDLLTTNPHGRINYKIKTAKKPHFNLKQSFKTAASNFDLIKENTISVIVEYDNKELMDQLYDEIENRDYHGIKRTLKRLQPYTIAIRRSEEYENSVHKQLDGQIFILNREEYDEKVGLMKGELQLLMF